MLLDMVWLQVSFELLFQKLKKCLVGSAKVDGRPRAMILDTIVAGKFILKYTYAENTQLEMAVDAEVAPEDFFFLHIVLKPSSLQTRLKTTIGKLFRWRCS